MSESNAWPATVFANELDTSCLERKPDRIQIRGGCWWDAVFGLRAPYGCDPDAGRFSQFIGAPAYQCARRSYLGASDLIHII